MAEVIKRQDAEALIQTQLGPEIMQGTIQNSVVLSKARRLPNMTSKQTKLRVTDALPIAGFVDGDTGLKPTSKAAWANKFINAEEIAVIIPIPEAVLADADYDIIGETKPLIEQAFGQVIDAAILYGKDKPQSWDMGLVDQIRNAGNNYAFSAQDSLYKQIDGTMSLVENDGFVPTVIYGGVELKSAFRNMVDTTGQPIQGTEIDSIPRVFVMNGSWDKTNAKFITGDFNNLVYAIREDITYKVLTEATITDANGKVLYNLAQQDMVALRVKMRLGWTVPNPINALEPDNAKRFPFALAEPDAEAPTVQTVTFTVKDATSGKAPVEGAKVLVGNTEHITGSAGTTTFSLPAGKYLYSVSKDGHSPRYGEFTVAAAAVAVAVDAF